MPSLNFKGKNAVWNHHLSVPYHVLEKDKKNSLKGKNEDENLIIEGDNLLALKSLLPKYQGKIKCIYIDPPYNTGNEGWVYNDNVNNPIIKTWIKETVGKEGEDMVRHDKWLCMMTPRLKLLRELLSEDGVIFVSIDDNEVHNLRTIMEEMFGNDNIEQAIWKKFDPKYDKNTNAKIINRTKRVHEYILIAYKDKNETLFNKIKKMPNWLNSYTNPDNDPRGPYKQGIISFEEGHQKEDKNSEYYYTITLPSGRKLTRHFFVTKEEYHSLFSDNRIYVPRDGDGIPALKIFENEEKDFYFETILEGVGSMNSAKKEIAEIFEIDEDKIIFDTPKPSKLIKEMIRAVTDKNSIILDSYAGSGSTGQAVIDLNKEDQGNRKFILVQLPETLTEKNYAKSMGYKFVHEITRDRMKKVIERDNLNIGFTYYKLGPSIDGKKLIEGKDMPSWESLAKYVYNLATGKGIDDVSLVKSTWQIKGTDVYLIYKDSIEELKNLAITRDWLESVKEKEGKKIVYAPACFLDKETLDEYNISFVQIPFNLFTRT
jgi:adenine-specific DNA-methyltransferase